MRRVVLPKPAAAEMRVNLRVGLVSRVANRRGRRISEVRAGGIWNLVVRSGKVIEGIIAVSGEMGKMWNETGQDVFLCYSNMKRGVIMVVVGDVVSIA